MATPIVQGVSRTIRVGPFIDVDTGLPRADLAIVAADIRVSKGEDKFTPKDDATDAIHEIAGFYQSSLSGADTDTPGSLVVMVNVAGALVVWKEYEVLPAAVYAQRITEGVTALMVENAVLDAIILNHNVGGSLAVVIAALEQVFNRRFTAEEG